MNEHKQRETELCRLDELQPGSTRGFSIKSDKGFTDLFLVREGDEIYAYLNSCPHTGGPLDWVPDQFLSLDGDLIQCATHDALFRIDNGACVSGPCAGQSLTSLPVVLRADKIWVRV